MYRQPVTTAVLLENVDSCWPTGCFKISSPPKTFRNIFTLVKSFCVKFCTFVGNSYPPYIYQFLYIYLNISSNGVNFSTSPIVFTLSSSE